MSQERWWRRKLRTASGAPAHLRVVARLAVFEPHCLPVFLAGFMTVRLAFLISLLATFPLQMTPFRDSLWKLLFRQELQASTHRSPASAPALFDWQKACAELSCKDVCVLLGGLSSHISPR